jgi:hypothetical protein
MLSSNFSSPWVHMVAVEVAFEPASTSHIASRGRIDPSSHAAYQLHLATPLSIRECRNTMATGRVAYGARQRR